MSEFEAMKYIIFVGYFGAPAKMIKEANEYFADHGVSVEYVLINDKAKYDANPTLRKKIDRCSALISQSFLIDDSSVGELEQTLEKFQGNILAVVPKGETMLDMYSRIIRAIGPEVHAPSIDAIERTSEKSKMRDAFMQHDPAITVRSVALDALTTSVDDCLDRTADFEFPVIVKPGGLSTSMYVYRVESQDELRSRWDEFTQKISQGYVQKGGRGKPEVIVEEFISGQLYSVDGYVDSTGVVTLLSFVRTITGKEAGRDQGYYGYIQVCPSDLSDSEAIEARKVAEAMVHATGLRSSTAHIELIRKLDGSFKAVELGARPGGYRTSLYALSAGVPHFLNDILVRADLELVLGEYAQHALLLKVYTRQEGMLRQVNGLPELGEGVLSVTVQKEEGEIVRFSENGDVSLVHIVLAGPGYDSIVALAKEIDDGIQVSVVADTV